ncbi:glycosyltransferase [Flavobacterium sp. FBOR7N2.3]|uniref:Glycosyltransferase n=1 Tax=Flavobacterium magnesitis TaxID=3138077 RepID=A0ABV4TFK0_9FLAO
MIKVCYFTSKAASDVRVFEKECTSLANAGYKVYLVSPNAKEEIKNGVHIIGVPYDKEGLINRLFTLPKLLYKKALSINADIYHFNDPASLPYGAKLKRRGKKVIFDSFEDHPTLFFEKKSLPYIIRYIVSKIYSVYEYYNCKKFDGLILCYHWTQERLSKACKNNQLVFNFPILKEENTVLREDIIGKSICYAGLISRMWYIENILTALIQLDGVQFNLAGNPADMAYLNMLKINAGWKKVNYLRQIEHREVNDKVYSKSTIAMALLDYIPLCKGNVGNLSNNKLFEYMKAGLPVICTDFILWKEVVEKNNCGICVNPRNINEIAEAIKYLTDNPDIAKQMGENGRNIVLEKYNWQYEEKKLIDVYRSL